MQVKGFKQIFLSCISLYHQENNIDAQVENVYEKSIDRFIFEKCWIDTVQWHLEDLIRDPDIHPSEALSLKRRIDFSNQKRNDIVEEIDNYFFELYRHIVPQKTARLNTETPAWALDRLSILCLKIFHFKEEINCSTNSQEHKERCMKKLAILTEQEKDLCYAIEQLLEEIQQGSCLLKRYKQMKMYNDTSLNPVLKKKL